MAQLFLTRYLPHHLLTYRLVLFTKFTIVYVKTDVRCKKFKMNLVKASYQVGLKMAKISPQKNYKLKPILTMLLTF